MSFLTTRERERCKELLPGVQWLEPLKDIEWYEGLRLVRSDQVWSIAEVDYDHLTAVLRREGQLGTLTRVFLHLQQEVCFCASDQDEFDNGYPIDEHEKHRCFNLPRVLELVRMARGIDKVGEKETDVGIPLPWSLIIGTVHAVGGVCLARTEPDLVLFSPETHTNIDNCLFHMLAQGYDLAEGGLEWASCPGYWAKKYWTCCHRMLVKRAVQRYTNEHQRTIRNTLHFIVWPDTAIGLSLADIINAFLT